MTENLQGAIDKRRLLEALALAETAIGISDPNPRVGCVIADAQGRTLGAGATREAGGPHAEVVALQAARDGGHDLRGATVWVTLEPCAHHGRTPPCCDALISSGVARVVVAVEDPFPAVAGKGIVRMRTAGIRVDMADAATADAARELNIGFFARIERGRPWVRLKVAASLDGRTALPDGRSQWITGEEARVDGHRWRRRASAVLTGVGTVLADDPRMDVRGVSTSTQPLRVIVDSQLRTPLNARILQAPGRVLVATVVSDPARLAPLALAGAEVMTIPSAAGRVDLRVLLTELAKRVVNEVHVEAGQTLNGALFEQELIDELLVYVAPKVIGPGCGYAAYDALSNLADAHQFRYQTVQFIGTDLRLTARPVGRVPGIGGLEIDSTTAMR